MRIHIFLSIGVILVSGAALGQVESLSRAMETMKQRADAMNDYSCVYESFSSDGEKTMSFVFSLQFMKPKKIRLKVLRGDYVGTVMIYNPSKVPDKIRIKMGNRALALVQKLFYGEYFDVTDKVVLDVRGFGMHQSGWPHFVDEHMKYIRHGEGAFVREDTVEGKPALLYVLTSKDPEKTYGVKKEELWIDKHTRFPVKYIQYDDSGNVIRRSVFRDLQIDTGLEADLFENFG